MSLLVQKASGTNSVHFSSPTTVGNTIVLLIAWQGPANEFLEQVGNEGKISAGANIFAHHGSGFVYNQKQPVTDSTADTQCAIMQCPNAASISDISTIGWATPHDRIMWAYELQDMPVSISAAFLGSLDSSGFTQDPSTNIDVDFFGGFSWFDEDDGVCKFDVVVATTDSGDITTVASPWTLDTIIDSRFAAAYTESKNVLTDIPVFTSSVATNYAVNAEAIFSNDADCVAPVTECCPPAIPPDGPFNDFTELDQFRFFPGNALRASDVAILNKNILEATLSPEVFPPVIKHQGEVVALPVSSVDSYAYTRPELTYLWNWNNTGPESDIRLPIFGAHIDEATGIVHLDVWRLPAGHPPKHTDDGSIRVTVIGSRQAQHPAIVDSGPIDPTGGGSGTDIIQGTLALTAQGAAFPPTLLFTVPTGQAGTYQISYVAKVTRVAGTSSSLGGANGFQVSYTDAGDLQELTTPPTPVNAGNALSSQISGVVVINAADDTPVDAQLDYSSLGSPTMQFSLEIDWKKL